MGRPRKSSNTSVQNQSQIHQKSSSNLPSQSENTQSKPITRPKNSMNIEYFGKNRPPWYPFMKIWDNVYDVNLGRDKKIEVLWTLIKDGKQLPVNQATEDCRCVAFNVPIKIANNMFRDAVKDIYREYDQSREFVPERDIVGYKVIEDSRDQLQQQIKILEKEKAEMERTKDNLERELGKRTANKLMDEPGVGAITEEAENLMPVNNNN